MELGYKFSVSFIFIDFRQVTVGAACLLVRAVAEYGSVV